MSNDSLLLMFQEFSTVAFSLKNTRKFVLAPTNLGVGFRCL